MSMSLGVHFAQGRVQLACYSTQHGVISTVDCHFLESLYAPLHGWIVCAGFVLDIFNVAPSQRHMLLLSSPVRCDLMSPLVSDLSPNRGPGGVPSVNHVPA